MKYVSIDLETTGLDPLDCQILEFAAVIEDTERMDIPLEKLPHYSTLIRWQRLRGEIFAFNMNKEIIQILYDNSHLHPNQPIAGLTKPEHLGLEFGEFCNSHGVDSKRIVAAGKNFASFDLQFLKFHPEFMQYCGFHHRCLDPGSMYFKAHMKEIPGMKQIMEYLDPTTPAVVKHRAYEDALEVIREIRIELKRK